MPTRSRKEIKRYRKHRKTEAPRAGCPFCDIQDGYSQFIGETKSFKLIRNIFSYDHWDLQDVTDHLLVVPKKHTDKLGDLSRSEMVEFMDIISSYEARGYNIYARAPATITKSIVHQHTHLIKPGYKFHRFLFFVRKPYIRFLR